ncbi:MAG TPA: ATP-binding protein [Bryobacteraceae bacterium]|jgi:heavy metal sensor kinase|nr:ATP-binding protein [Bryobacteraceae bacterium]
MTRRSLRFRLTVWYGLVLFAALGLFSGLIWLSLRQRLLSEIDEDLAARAGQFERYVVHEAAEVPAVQLTDELEEFCQALPPSSFLQLRGSTGFEFRYPQKAASPKNAVRTLNRSFAAAGETFDLQISDSLKTAHHTLELLQLLLFSLVPVVILIACAGGAWLSRRALKPVDDITAAARSISIENLSQRLPAPQTGDELQRLTEVWNTMLSRLESAVNTLSQFAADASHELRTPLSVIRTSAEVALRRARSAESYRDSLGEIAEEAERMTQLVEDLLLLARSDAPSAAMPKEALELNGVVEEASAQLRGVAEARGIRVKSEVRLNQPAVVSGNRPALRRLFLVLLDNAIKYSHPDSEVKVAIARDGQTVGVAIEDAGIGISEADQPHIFQRFYQADQARTDRGFGLGLSLAERIAHEHGATIEVKSQEGAGSRFLVTFSSMTGAARE